MTSARLAAPAFRRAPLSLVAVILALAALVAVPVAGPTASVARAATAGPIATLVVGPSGSGTLDDIRAARGMASQLRSYGATVREVYSPNATWPAVAAAARGAHLFVYFGRGRGYPSPYGAFDSRKMDGLGLSRAAASGHSNLRWFGEYYVRSGLDLAAGSIVILKGVPYAAGSSEPGRALPTRDVAVKRADNYAAGFLAAGAAAVFAGDRSFTSVIRDLFGASRSIRAVFWRSPSTSTTYDTSFTSRRSSGSSGILAPYSPGRYLQSVVGRLGSTTTSWRRSWDEPVRVSSVTGLLAALAVGSTTEIIVANGIYPISPASEKRSTSLWIGARYAKRAHPVIVRAETAGGVIFDGGGQAYFGCISFEEGAHHQTWIGFRCANGHATDTGVITFGGYAGLAAPHHITLRSWTIDPTVRGRATTANGNTLDHGVYISKAVGGPHDLVFDDMTIDGRGGLASAFHFYHSDSANRNAWNVTIRRLTVVGTQQAIILWDRTLRNITVNGAVISNALAYAIRHEARGATGIVYANVTSTGSGSGRGFYSSLGSRPTGVTFVSNSLR